MKKSIIKIVKNILKPYWSIYQLMYMFYYDGYRYIRYSGVFSKKSSPSLRALVTKRYHMIEKGLALPEPRPGFGKENVELLCKLTHELQKKKPNSNEILLTIDALESYRDFNLNNNILPDKHVIEIIDRIRESGVSRSGNAVRECGGGDSHQQYSLDLLMTRRSVRDFLVEEIVPDFILENAVRAAQQAPAVCNRQAGRIHLIKNTEMKKNALSFQNGNRGFGETASVIAIVTVDQAEMLEPTERYQHWIDGGMFAQNFLLAIHAQGYGACPLNWSAKVGADRAIRKKLGFIKKTESIIMLIAIGALKSSYKVARSERRPIDEVMKIY